MANIKIKSFGIEKLSENALEGGYLYKDLELDLKYRYSYNNQLNKREYLNDISSLYDLQAVKTSIVTAFTTSPGQNILNPLYGIDLREYLFKNRIKISAFADKINYERKYINNIVNGFIHPGR